MAETRERSCYNPEFAEMHAIMPTHWMPLPELPKEDS